MALQRQGGVHAVVLNLRVGVDQRTVARYAELIHKQNLLRTYQVAADVGDDLVKEARRIVDAERRSDGANRKPRPDVRPLTEMYTKALFQTPTGWRVAITNRRGLRPSERGKFFMNEFGSSKPQWEGDSATVQRKARPGRHIARRARDRVYQRIRRGTV